MRAEIIGYNASQGQLTLAIRTLKDGEAIPMGAEIEIDLSPKESVKEE